MPCLIRPYSALTSNQSQWHWPPAYLPLDRPQHALPCQPLHLLQLQKCQILRNDDYFPSFSCVRSRIVVKDFTVEILRCISQPQIDQMVLYDIPKAASNILGSGFSYPTSEDMIRESNLWREKKKNSTCFKYKDVQFLITPAISFQLSHSSHFLYATTIIHSQLATTTKWVSKSFFSSRLINSKCQKPQGQRAQHWLHKGKDKRIQITKYSRKRQGVPSMFYLQM